LAVILPNLDRIAKADPKLGEALKKAQDYLNSNVALVPGNRVQPPAFVNPTRRPG
jgi:hypothetical protein